MISIDYSTYIIYIPKNYMSLIQESPEIRELNINTFRLDLKNLEDDEEGMPFPKTHNHNSPVSIGGLELARVVEILEPYTITFENGSYMANLVGANSNIADKTNFNQVSVRSANSAGLIVTGGGISQEDKLDIADVVWEHTIGSDISTRVNLIRKIEENRWKIENKKLIIYDSDGVTVLKQFNLYDKYGQASDRDVMERVPI